VGTVVVVVVVVVGLLLELDPPHAAAPRPSRPSATTEAHIPRRIRPPLSAELSAKNIAFVAVILKDHDPAVLGTGGAQVRH
jgi:hypothetical protein